MATQKTLFKWNKMFRWTLYTYSIAWDFILYHEQKFSDTERKLNAINHYRGSMENMAIWGYDFVLLNK